MPSPRSTRWTFSRQRGSSKSASKNHSLRRSQHHCQEVAHNIKKNIQKKISYIYYFLLDIYFIIFIIIIAQMVKVASEVPIRRRTSKSAIRIYPHNIFVFSFFLGVLPTVVAHPVFREYHHLLDPGPCHLQQQHLLNLHHSNIQPQHSQFHFHHFSFSVHHACAYNFSYFKNSPSLLYHPTFHLHSQNQVHRHSHLCQGRLCNLLIYCRVHADVDVMAQGSQCKRISVYCVRVHVCLVCSRTLTSLRTRPPF